MIDIKKLLSTAEDEFHDFKQNWHKDKSELVRDILNFVNTTHHEDCHIIFGVSDDLKIVGVENDPNRKDTESLTDMLHKLYLSTNTQIKISISTHRINDKEIDILTIFDTKQVPVYLTKDYKPKKSKGLQQGLIYSRIGPRNTPINETVNYEQLNKLFKKHNRLDVSIQEQYEYILNDYENWSYLVNNEGTFFVYNLNPDFHIILREDELCRSEVEAFSLNQFHVLLSWEVLEMRYRNIIIQEFLLNYLDQGKALVTNPKLGVITINTTTFGYYYLLKNSLDYKLLNFIQRMLPTSDTYSLEKFKNSIVLFEDKYEQEKRILALTERFTQEKLLESITPDQKEKDFYDSCLLMDRKEVSESELLHIIKQYKLAKLINSNNS